MPSCSPVCRKTVPNIFFKNSYKIFLNYSNGLWCLKIGMAFALDLRMSAKNLKMKGFWLLEQGFSLVELLVVAAVISLLVAIAIPQFQNFLLKSYRAEAILTLKAVHAHEIGYFANFDQFYPPNAPSGNPSSYSITVHPTIANPYFGIGPATTSFTKSGWKFSVYYGFGPVASGIPNKTVGYFLMLSRNMDDDAGDEEWLIHSNGRSGPMDYCSGGVPLQIVDDITNQITLTCP
jgi:prepilin-type N-terminal cleavage/methylation domain-containing protein